MQERQSEPQVGKIPWRREWQLTPVRSCLENPMDRGAWRATVRGVARSQTPGCKAEHFVLQRQKVLLLASEDGAPTTGQCVQALGHHGRRRCEGFLLAPIPSSLCSTGGPWRRDRAAHVVNCRPQGSNHRDAPSRGRGAWAQSLRQSTRRPCQLAASVASSDAASKLALYWKMPPESYLLLPKASLLTFLPMVCYKPHTLP